MQPDRAYLDDALDGLPSKPANSATARLNSRSCEGLATADRSLTLKELKARAKHFGVTWSEKRGKGSHLLFEKEFADGTFSYPVPAHSKDLLERYVKGFRKKVRLRETDGVTDKEFYGTK